MAKVFSDDKILHGNFRDYLLSEDSPDLAWHFPWFQQESNALLDDFDPLQALQAAELPQKVERQK